MATGGGTILNTTVDRLGLCVICGDRVHSHEDYLEATEGYCHQSCVNNTHIVEAEA
ncbi:hypothetical protein [Candidatus Nanohalovita haloferacivicina]|uniref:hypothetical protein n=1 Tax=Candidatus Nanohalovita haloferacivicina TaxID=2978046 RepID=UPI00325FDD86|nr:hypothetical protein HBNXNv_0363 [Candidatus Nanohalobia archaeon BNXNv]